MEKMGHIRIGASLISIIAVLFAIEEFLLENNINVAKSCCLKDVSSCSEGDK